MGNPGSHYQANGDDQADLKQRTQEIAKTCVRYGYRPFYVLLRRKGWHLNPKRIYRLYKEIELQLRNKTSRRRLRTRIIADTFSQFSPATDPQFSYRGQIVVRKLERACHENR